MAPAKKKAALKKKAVAKIVGPPPTLAMAAAPTREIIGLHVRFELMTRTELRQVIFDLTKKVDAGVTKWKIEFTLNERTKKENPFVQIIKLLVEVDTKLNDKAQKMADDGMNDAQAAHALGSAADDSKAAAAGTLPQSKAAKTVQNTVKQ